jgi:hypothetical protein
MTIEDKRCELTNAWRFCWMTRATGVPTLAVEAAQQLPLSCPRAMSEIALFLVAHAPRRRYS